MGCHVLLQGIFPVQGLNFRLLVSCTARQVLYPIATWETHICIYAHTIHKHIFKFVFEDTVVGFQTTTSRA